MSLIWGWIIKHWSSVFIGLLLCWLSIGVTYVTFLKPSIKLSGNAKYIQNSDGLQPSVGCAIASQYIGWAHKK